MKKVLLWGGLAKSRIVDNMLKKTGFTVTHIFDKYIENVKFKTIAQFSNSEKDLAKFISETEYFVVCIGGAHGKARHLITKALIKKGLKPLNIISENSFIDDTSVIGISFQAMPGSLVHSYSVIGDCVIVNSSATIDHDCIVGNGCHFMGSSAVSGSVIVKDYVTVGTNATILPNITIGEGAYIGAGSVVIKDVLPNQVVVGNPAKFLKINKQEYDISFFNQ
jgi:acetyltransferase EpsM